MGQSQSQTAAAAYGAMPPADHPRIPSSATQSPPPGCPMHENTTTNANASSPSSSSSSPYAPVPASLRPEADVNRPAACPIQHDTSNGSSSLNPLNQMPSLSHERAPGQETDLPTSRTSSSIPRPSTSKTPLSAQASPENTAPGYAASASLKEDVWEYPSPQQFYNALIRKGFETPEDSVEMMVEIHNFLNEQAWRQVLGWEARYPGGSGAILARFQGNPGKLSPRARLHGWMGWLLPSRFSSEPPFDRHDWVVHRTSPTDPHGPATETRYVIDYYSAPPDEEGNPVFYLDTRPALDSVGAVVGRIGEMARGAFGRGGGLDQQQEE